MALISYFKSKGDSGYGYNSTAEQVTEGLDLTGKIYLVTGCNSGMGKETARILSMRGAKVIVTGRTEEKARKACAQFSPLITPLACELSQPESVNECIKTIIREHSKLDGIICNAGIMALPKLKQAHGYELQFFTNHVGHFILVTGLLEHLTNDARIVMLSSSAHHRTTKDGIAFDNLTGEKRYSAWQNYGQSKLANLLFAKALSKRFEGTNRTANAVHPGVIQTKLIRNLNYFMRIGMSIINPLFLKSIPEGSSTQCYVATHPELAKTSGKYFADCNIKKPSRYARSSEMAERLWKVTEDIIAKL